MSAAECARAPVVVCRVGNVPGACALSRLQARAPFASVSCQARGRKNDGKPHKVGTRRPPPATRA